MLMYLHQHKNTLRRTTRSALPRTQLSPNIRRLRWYACRVVDALQAVNEVRTVNAPSYRYLLDAAATSVATHSSSIPDAISTLESSLLAVFNSSSPQWPATVRLYRSSILYNQPPFPAPPQPPAPPGPVLLFDPSKAHWWEYDLLPVLLCVLTMVVVYFLWRRWRSTFVKEGLISHPGVGPLSTLVVTGTQSDFTAEGVGAF